MKKKRKSKMGLAKLYLSSFGIFVLGFLVVFISPFVLGGSYSYPEAALNERQSINNNISIALVKKEINTTEKLMRLDYSIHETSSNASLSNIKYEVSSQYITGKEPLEVTVNKINDNYLVVLVKGMPKDFGVISTTISPQYIHPEIQNTDDLTDREAKFYINQSTEIENTQLTEGTETEYKKEYITYQQDQIKEEVTEKEKEIQNSKLAIKEINNQIESLESEMIYQTSEEKFQTTNNINSYKTSITKYEKEIEEFYIVIEELQEKIRLLEEKRNSIE